jgi:hypothetical protein
MVNDQEYVVGKGRPPRHSRFKKGQSGNPSGRRKGSKNVATLLKQVLNERVTVAENGQRKRITKLEAMLKQLANKGASGDQRAISLVLRLQADYGLAQNDVETEKPKSQAEIEAETAQYIDLFRGGYQILADLGVPMPQAQERPHINTPQGVESVAHAGEAGRRR